MLSDQVSDYEIIDLKNVKLRRKKILMSHSQISEGIYTRLKRDSLTNQPDLFVNLRQINNLVLPLVPFLAPPPLVVPSKLSFPSEDEVSSLIEKIFDQLNLPHECGIVALIYLDRLRVFSGLNKGSWRLVVSLAFLVAVKMWEDSPRRWILEFANLTHISERKLCQAETLFCETLAYNLHIDGEEYRQYSLTLRVRDRPVYYTRPSHLL